jgi:exopolysaccharide biosynthesis WecB/TagA/CpsF family protein
MNKFCLLLDNKNTAEFTDIAASFGVEEYGYVVTPNVDHIIRLYENCSFRDLYADATYTLLDSRFLSHLLRLIKGHRLPVCTGSDLSENIIGKVVKPDDALVLIGGTEKQAKLLCERYNLRQLYHYNPPMGFINDPKMVEECLEFIEQHSPFRFCFLAVGSPRQEVLAQQLKVRGIARGLALCIGASIDFLTGEEHRAPLWMQRSGTEWLFRLLQAPRRMSKRYLLRGPRIFRLLFNMEIVLRETNTPN